MDVKKKLKLAKDLASIEASDSNPSPGAAALASSTANESIKEVAEVNVTRAEASTEVQDVSADAAIAASFSQSLDDFTARAGSSRNVGNLLATVGTMRSNAVLAVASLALPQSFFKDAPKAKAPWSWSSVISIENSAMSLRGVLVCVVIVAVLAVVAWQVAQGRLAKEAGKEVPPEDEVTFAALVDLARNAIRIIVPVVFGAMAAMSIEVVSVVCIGRVGTPAQLAAVGLCNMLLNCMAMCWISGILSVMDTLVAGAWGSGNKELCVTYLQRARFVAWAQVAWILPALWYSHHVLLWLGQDPEVAKNTILYIRTIGSCTPLFFHFIGTSTFLKNIGDPFPQFVTMMCAVVVNVCTCTFFVLYLRWGNTGLACSYSIGVIMQSILLGIYLVRYSAFKDFPMQKKLFFEPYALDGLGNYISLAIPAAFSASAECWYWEINTLMMGSLGKIPLAAHVATANVAGCFSMAGLGLSVATSTIVGTLMGAGKWRLARAVCWLSLAVVIGICIPFFGAMFLFRPLVAGFYVDNPEIAKVMQQLLSVVCITNLFGLSQFNLSGALRGMAQQKYVAASHLTTYYLVGLPTAFVLAFPLRFGIVGVYYATLTANVLVFCVFTLLIAGWDFEKSADDVAKRMEKEVQGGKTVET